MKTISTKNQKVSNGNQDVTRGESDAPTFVYPKQGAAGVAFHPVGCEEARIWPQYIAPFLTIGPASFLTAPHSLHDKSGTMWCRQTRRTFGCPDRGCRNGVASLPQHAGRRALCRDGGHATLDSCPRRGHNVARCGRIAATFRHQALDAFWAPRLVPASCPPPIGQRRKLCEDGRRAMGRPRLAQIAQG